MRKPTAQELADAVHRTVPDVIGPGLRVLFCGINPGLYSAATGCHFARPGNRFWPALAASGFTARTLAPDQQCTLPAHGLGITNVCPRTTARAAELTADELRAGAARLADTVRACRPRWLAVLGVTAYRTGFGRRDAAVGRQPDRIGDTGIWVLPNPSGLNAHYTPAALAAAFGELRRAADEGTPGAVHPTGDPGTSDGKGTTCPG